jgi:hypothetical protein
MNAGATAYGAVSSIRTVLSLNAVPKMIRQYSAAMLCLDADQGAREWKGERPKTFNSKYLNFLGEQRMKLTWSFIPLSI